MTRSRSPTPTGSHYKKESDRLDRSLLAIFAIY